VEEQYGQRNVTPAAPVYTSGAPQFGHSKVWLNFPSRIMELGDILSAFIGSVDVSEKIARQTA
jgi:hypothetical protein